MGFGLVRRLAALGVRLLTGTRVQSPLSGQRAVKAEVLQRVGGLAQGFGVEVSLTIGALYHGFTLREVPVPMKHRAYGRSIKGFLHRGRQLIHVVKALMYCWRRVAWLIWTLAAGVFSYLSVAALLPIYQRQRAENYLGESVPSGLGYAFLLPAVLAMLLRAGASAQTLLLPPRSCSSQPWVP